MKRNNICKFVTPEYKAGLSVSCFVLETDPAVMQNKTPLSAHKIILVTKGAGTFFFDTFKTRFSTGDLIFGFKGEIFHAEIEEACEYMYLLYEGDRADELLCRFAIQKSNRRFAGYDSLVPFWKESLSRADKQTVDLASESILLYTFSRLTSQSATKNGLIYKLVDILEKRFNDPELSIGAIAAELSYNQKYISHLFKEQMGMGFSEYLRTVRIKYAISLLDHGIDSVKNVALLSGFTDPMYFSTVFRKEVGVSPKEYINGERQP